MPDPFTMTPDDVSQMTHWAPQPNPVHPLINAIGQYLQSGDFSPVHMPGTQPSGYLSELLQYPDILSKNIEQASQFNFGGVATPVQLARIKTMIESGASLAKIAGDLGMPRSTVKYNVDYLGIASKNPVGGQIGAVRSEIAPDEAARLKSLADTGASITQIAKELGLPRSTVGAKISSLGLKSKNPQGGQNPWTAEKDQAIIDGLKTGKTWQQIAIDVGVPRGVVRARAQRMENAGQLSTERVVDPRNKPTLPQPGFTAGNAPQIDPEMQKAMILFLMKTGRLER